MTTLVDAPLRVDGVHLIGAMEGSGYRVPPALVRRGDGQVLQLTPLLYLVLSAVDGRRTCAEIGDLVGRRLGRTVTGEDVRTLVDGHLRPLGLVALPDGSVPETRRTNPLLRIRPRVAITDPRTTRRVTAPFRLLFRPFLTTVVALAFLMIVGWVFFDRGLGASAYDAFERPHLLLLVFVVSILSAGFHEFGHAAAARYGGAQPGVMGAGLYIVWPAFYTDVTDSYRLGRAGRLRTDLGGLYFNAIVVVATFIVWWLTGWEALLLLVATQVLQMVHQLLPLLRFDGYHVLADLAGVPDLYHRIRPTLLGLLPHRWRSPENRALKPSARALITLWVLVTVPMMVLMLLAMIAAVPRLLGTAGHVVGTDAAAVAAAWHAGSTLDVASHAVQVFAVVVPMAGCAMILGRLGYRYFRGLARWSHGSAPKRAVAILLGAALVTALLWTWWPRPGAYEPLRPGDKSLYAMLHGQQRDATLTTTAGGPVASAYGAAARERLSADRPLVAAFEKGTTLPTKAHPMLAMVLVPADRPGSGTGSGTGSSTSQDPWVFPFDKPLPPGEGDNQALAVASTDGAVRYDVAFAMVWAEGDEVLNVNEAHAYASCTDCVAVAVAFQVVLVMDDAQVIVPQNLAVAASYRCYRCITAAVASQLVLSLGSDPSDDQLLALGDVWSRLLEFGRSITSYSLAQITTQLDSFKKEIVAILGSAPPVSSDTALTTPTPTPSTTGGDATSPAPTDTSDTTGTSGTTGTTTTDPTPAPDPAPAPETSAPPADPPPTDSSSPSTTDTTTGGATDTATTSPSP